MVVVPEQHLQRPRIPDPAAETAINKALIDAGFKVIDSQRISEIRYDSVIDRIVKKGPNWQADAKRLGEKYGADILVTGEAFSELVSRQNVQTDLGSQPVFTCSGRLEVKAFRCDTAEIVFSDAKQETGPQDLSEELSSKSCLSELGADLSPSLISKLSGLSTSSSEFITIEVRGLKNYSAANQIAGVVRGFPTVTHVDDPDFQSGFMSMEIQAKRSTIGRVASLLESSAKLKKYHLRVQSASKSKIIANVK